MPGDRLRRLFLTAGYLSAKGSASTIAPHSQGAFFMFHGSIVALVTPMNERGQIDLEGLHRLVEFQLANGTDALVIAGTTGEGATLGREEFRGLLRQAVRIVHGRVPVIAGTGSVGTAKAISLTMQAEEAGADAALVVTPYYNRPMQSGLEAHFSAIADATNIPLILYNVPSRTAVDLLPETVSRLAAREDIVAIKEARPGVGRISELVDRVDDQLVVLSGDDSSCMDAIFHGAGGVVSVAANVVPGVMHRLCEAARSGDRDLAGAINDGLKDLFRFLALESNPIPVKWAVAQMGLIGAGIRLPLLPLGKANHASANHCLRTLGLLTD
jgi:4-hydroxy-tetrahydrodipicolinate synthase